MPALSDGHLRHRGGVRRPGRRAGLDPIRRGRQLHRRGHHPRRDDARRHRRGRPPRRRALRPPRRHRDRTAAHRPAHPGRRRRARGPGVRHGRRQGHPGARPERLRDRPPPRPAEHHGHGRARGHHRPRPVPGPGPAGGAFGGRRRAARRGTHRRREAPLRPLRRPLLALQDDHRAAAVDAVVGEGRSAGAGRRRRGPRRAGRHPPQGDGVPLLRLGRQPPRLVHLPPAVVGPPHPGLVRPERRDRLRRPGRGAPERRGLAPGQRCAGHLVLLRPVALLHPRVAGEDREPGEVLSELRAGHRLRHPLLLGRPDDDVRPLRDGRHPAVPPARAARHGPRPVRQEDVEVLRQRGQPAGLDGHLRLRRAALHPRARRQPRCRRPHRRGLGPGLPQLRQQGVERHPLRADERRHGRGRPARARGVVGDRPLDPLPAEHGRGRGGRPLRRLPVRQALRPALPLRVGRGLRLVRRAVQDHLRRGR